MKILHPSIEKISLPPNPYNVQLQILRLDKIHPHVSGNKWFKLIENYHQALSQKKSAILTFGGAYSNHLHATAYFGNVNHIQTIGIVRGEELDQHSNPTLSDCAKWGMQLHFVSRKRYSQKEKTEDIQALIQQKNAYFIPEGGNNDLGVKGSQLISRYLPCNTDVIACSIGTGTTLSGIINGFAERATFLGFVPMKGGKGMIDNLTKYCSANRLTLIDKYHFGGFGRYNQDLIDFIIDFYGKYNIHLDIVYNAKMMYGVLDLINKGYFKDNTTITAIHTGGLQGNRTIHQLLNI